VNSPSDLWPDLQRGLNALSDASSQWGRTLLGNLGLDDSILPSLAAPRGRPNRFALLTPWPWPSSRGADQQSDKFQATLFRIKERLRDIAGDDWEKTVVVDGKAVLAKAANGRRILVAWISVVESLAQIAEVECAGRSGADKKLWVKAIARRLYRKERLSLPMVPRWAEPLVIDGLVDIGIDFVVALNDRDNSWQHTKVRRSGFLRRLWWSLPLLFAPLKRLLRALVQPLLRLGVRLYVAWADLRLRLAPIPPGLEQALKEVDTSGVKRDIAALEDFVTDQTDWLRNNRQRIMALLDLAADAAQEAEWYAGLDGPAKKAYATDLLLAVLADAGVKPMTALGDSLIRFGVDQVIEAVVLLMNKRGVLKRPRTKAKVTR